MQEKILIIDNVRSAHNVGSLFRTADGAGVSSLVLVGYTPTPIDRFGRIQNEIEKTSLGASHTLPWFSKTNEEILGHIHDLKKLGFTVVAVEQTAQARDLRTFEVPEKVAYILGNEIDGVSKPLLEVADEHVAIVMHGKKESLNVSVAGGIVLFYRK
jgi:tRNA G18 (ribose-2'-O)-methylase SpoU